jgi:hypothetical protein
MDIFWLSFCADLEYMLDAANGPILAKKVVLALLADRSGPVKFPVGPRS